MHCFIMLAFISCPRAVAAVENGSVEVRVGYYENEVFQEGAQAGAVKTGYAYEYYQKLSEYTGWRYKYVYGNFSDLYQMLLDGKIDFLAGLAFKEERKSLICYPDSPMGNETYSLIKHDADEAITKETTVIILTSFNWDDIMDEALHIGVDSFLAKPLFASNVIGEFERIARKNNMSLYMEKKRADLKGRQLLMAEDNEINAEIMKEIIQARKAEIDHATNGKLVLEMFEKSTLGYYDAILMDVRMPEMDGLEAAAAIRALDRPDAKAIPIIALTANAFDEDVQRSLQVGMNAHLTKPLDPERLYQTLEELIWERNA